MGDFRYFAIFSLFLSNYRIFFVSLQDFCLNIWGESAYCCLFQLFEKAAVVSMLLCCI